MDDKLIGKSLKTLRSQGFLLNGRTPNASSAVFARAILRDGPDFTGRETPKTESLQPP